jgi:hypothetical protein
MSSKHQYYTERMKKLFEENPDSKLLEHRYRTIRFALYEEYKELMELCSKDKMLEFLRDIVYLDRKLRDLTEDIQIEEKKILSQEWCIKNDKPLNLFK